MGRISETQNWAVNQEILENKPYFSKQELSLLLEKRGKNLDKKISQLLRKNYLIPLKKGWYTTRIYFLLNKDKIGEYLANILYYPSYLSLEYVLQKEGLIPEAVYAYTSVTLKVPRSFQNQIGSFIYRKIKEPLFTGYYRTNFRENYQIKIATKAKALFDFLYFKSLNGRLAKTFVSDWRLNLEVLTRNDYQEFLSYVKTGQSPKMWAICQILKEKIYGRGDT